MSFLCEPHTVGMADFFFAARRKKRKGFLLPPERFEYLPSLDRQISGDLPVQPPLQKYFVSRLMQITSYLILSRPNEGRLAIVTNAGRDAVDADVLETNGTAADGEVVWS